MNVRFIGGLTVAPPGLKAQFPSTDCFALAGGKSPARIGYLATLSSCKRTLA
jgi:hypothetical protein